MEQPAGMGPAGTGRRHPRTGKDGCGVMVEAKNSRMLTEALEELLLDENLRREIGTKARMRVQEYYAIDNYVNQLVSYYEKLRKEG